jgi:putative intracellular protease/amidase
LLVGYRDADGLDLFGPAEVFAEAVRQVGTPVYELVVTCVGGGSVTLTSGLTVTAVDLTSVRPQATDVVIVAGGADEASTSPRSGHRRPTSSSSPEGRTRRPTPPRRTARFSPG